jgi:hypothetical protein
MNDNAASNKNFSSNKEIERDFLKDVAQGCYQCDGQTKPRRYCGVSLNWLYGKPREYQSGEFHRCPEPARRRRYQS